MQGVQACTYCKFTGVMIDGTMRYPGYTSAHPVDATHGHESALGQSYQVTGEPDPLRFYTNDELRAMAEEAGRLTDPKARIRLPFDGRSILWDVKYFDFTTLFLVPFAHAFHHGVQKDFQAALLGKRKGGPSIEGMADPKWKRPAPLLEAARMVCYH
jgi:hypothetical protein